jgi:hypothetical protein
MIRFGSNRTRIWLDSVRFGSCGALVNINEKFEIGDKVLYYNVAKEKQWSGKLSENWKGPYYIHEILLNGSYKLKEIDGRILKVPVNGKWLKKYNSRENWEPMLVIWFYEDIKFLGEDSL